jgi:hypothetical protein
MELDAFKQIQTQKNLEKMRAQQPQSLTIWGGIKAIWEFTIGDLFRIFSIFKEIGNYFYIGRIIRQQKGSKSWNKFNLRTAYFNVIYTVINLPPEVYASEEVYWQAFVIENIKPLNDYLASLNLHEVIRPRIVDRINADNGIYAYVVKYVPLFRDLTFGWIFKWLLLVPILSWWLQYKFHAFTHAWHVVLWAAHFFVK